MSKAKKSPGVATSHERATTSGERRNTCSISASQRCGSRYAEIGSFIWLSARSLVPASTLASSRRAMSACDVTDMVGPPFGLSA